MRKTTLFLISTLFMNTIVSAQYRVVFQIRSWPAYHAASGAIYLAGSFNNWNTSNEAYRFSLSPTGVYTKTLQLPAGQYEFKVTRGTWDQVEYSAAGTPTQNRTLHINGDTTIIIDVANWSDHFPPPPRQSTATKNVHVIDTAFFIPQLNRYRRVWVYLPASYFSGRKRYPVLYMHDGQNVFDDATSFSGEWGVDEALDTLGTTSGECIVVAIDNGGDKRLNEYSPYDMERYGKGEGDQYVDFLVKTLKPYIEKKYRTKRGSKNRFIAGSSMGGLISFYAIVKYPNVFGGAGVFSPAFWIVPQLKTALNTSAKKVKGKIYFYAGKQESENMVTDMLSVFDQMHQHSKAKMTTVIRTEGRHNETAWRQEFPLFYRWMMQ